MLRMAILGVGWAGQRQIHAVRELNRKVTIECAVDNDPAFLEDQARTLGIDKTYTDYRHALNDPDVDAVSICLPHDLHHTVATDAAAAGKHILCEKPIAITVAQATDMIRTAHAHRVKLYVAENAVYTARAKLLHQLVRQGKYIGNLTSALKIAGFAAQAYGYPGRRAWLASRDRGGGGTWILHGIHSMAELRFVLGEVQVVYIQEHHAPSFQRTDLEATMSGLLTMAGGIHVFVLQTAETRLPGNVGGYIIHGDQGTIRAGKDHVEVFSSRIESDKQPLVLQYPPQELSDYAQEIEAFADYVTGASVGPTTAHSERRTLAIIQAGYESAQTGQPIDLKQRFGDL